MLQPSLLRAIPRQGCLLELHYATGEKKFFDVAPYISGRWFGELGDVAYFQSVRLLEDGKGIEWPHGQDIAPHELYELSFFQ
ncbi:MAG: DUF2442 domain-containing protein [Oscillospiraceae bacterium]|jgi:hypothetical protein|nr:DUF2442 domain-containing protein [Oscillospiraceae bacterium]